MLQRDRERGEGVGAAWELWPIVCLPAARTMRRTDRQIHWLWPEWQRTTQSRATQRVDCIAAVPVSVAVLDPAESIRCTPSRTVLITVQPCYCSYNNNHYYYFHNWVVYDRTDDYGSRKDPSITSTAAAATSVALTNESRDALTAVGEAAASTRRWRERSADNVGKTKRKKS